MTRLRITDQMSGGIETPRLYVTRAPAPPSGGVGAHINTISIMRMLLDIVWQSLSTLWAHKLRSFLTMFGIAWGVGSLLLLVGLGEGFRSGQDKNLAELGQDIMFVFPGRIPAVAGSYQSGQIYYLTYGDYFAIAIRPDFCGQFLPCWSATTSAR